MTRTSTTSCLGASRVDACEHALGRLDELRVTVRAHGPQVPGELGRAGLGLPLGLIERGFGLLIPGEASADEPFQTLIRGSFTAWLATSPTPEMAPAANAAIISEIGSICPSPVSNQFSR